MKPHALHVGAAATARERADPRVLSLCVEQLELQVRKVWISALHAKVAAALDRQLDRVRCRETSRLVGIVPP